MALKLIKGENAQFFRITYEVMQREMTRGLESENT